VNDIQTTYDLHDYLQKIFKYDSFQEGQEEIITDILNGRDVLGILRTGTGKSLCYQLPAKLLPGLTIVVSPLISLMIDQVRELKAMQYKEVAALHSIEQREIRQNILTELHKYKLLFVSPELLQNNYILTQLKRRQVSLFVVDEAHCISQWGYDFRTDYLRLPEVIASLNNPTVLALTGTATPDIQTDIRHKLKRNTMIEHIYPMDRENISLIVEEVAGSEELKMKRLIEWIHAYETPAIVYFSSRLKTEQIARHITGKISNKKIAYYHGGLDTKDRLKIQQQFMNDQLDVICCTSAFGMGINKPNIRMVIHYHLPTRVEAYIQEIGRAGRDGKDSVSVLLYRNEDIHIPLNIIEHELPNRAELTFILQRLLQYKREEERIPVDESVIEQQFMIEATKWRYLLYHLEKHQAVKEQEVFHSEEELTKVFKKIQQFTEMRLQEKRLHLQNVISWIHTKNCFRQVLYAPFQQAITNRSFNCCSNCGYALPTKTIEKQQDEQITETDWQTLLKKVLLIGDSY